MRLVVPFAAFILGGLAWAQGSNTGSDSTETESKSGGSIPTWQSERDQADRTQKREKTKSNKDHKTEKQSQKQRQNESDDSTEDSNDLVAHRDDRAGSWPYPNYGAKRVLGVKPSGSAKPFAQTKMDWSREENCRA